jgi:hypothetical protein
LKPKLYRNEEDYFWVKDFKKKNVSFLGLNSCWACEGDNDRNNITLGYPQIMDALKRSKISNRILLMHHPPNNRSCGKNLKNGSVLYLVAPEGWEI